MSKGTERKRLPWLWLLLLGFFPVCVYLVTVLAGGEDYLEVLSGTRPMRDHEVVLGLTHIASYVAMTITTPILWIASALLFGWNLVMVRN